MFTSYLFVCWTFPANAHHNTLQIPIDKLLRKIRNGAMYLSNITIRNDLGFHILKEIIKNPIEIKNPYPRVSNPNTE